MGRVLVDYSQIQQNWLTLGRFVGSGVDVAAVIKCDAYGLGIGKTAKNLHRRGCRTFFASTIQEAKEIRTFIGDDSARIIVLHPELKRHNIGTELRTYRLTPCICSLSDLAQVRNSGQNSDLVLYADTGLSQHGFTVGELGNIKALLHSLGRKRMTLLSHLAAAENPHARDNERQRSLFQAFCSELEPDERSLAASAGVMLGSAYHFDLVRIGDALFGINPRDSFPAVTRPAVSLIGSVVDIRTVPKGAAIGYGCLDILPKAARIAVVKTGYRHGYPRVCDGRRYAFMNGYFSKVVGQVTMEFTFLDVSHIPADKVSIGEPVELIGKHIPLNHVAETAGTVATDVMVRIMACADNPEQKDMPVERSLPAVMV
ncbi:alanine racemase [uncultured Roseibium sp.]|uniref:alanine racemase n=1 Tax=uncultured Roseibium sp. TaxID=1936171 RepID=UPI002628BED1|nr:alanine racemase [uncultured Roseibium sp.]